MERFNRDSGFQFGIDVVPYMEGMGVKFTPGMGGRLLRHSSVFGPMAGTSGTHS